VLAVAVDDDLVDVDRSEKRGDPRLELRCADGRQRLRDVERRHSPHRPAGSVASPSSLSIAGILTLVNERRTVGRQVTR